VYRATSILRLLEEQGMNPARMAIEGYGQYYPSADNTTVAGRAKNRKVVVAISKYGLEKSNLLNTPTISIKDVEAITKITAPTIEDNEVKIIRLPSGGIRITTRNEDTLSEVDDNISLKSESDQ
jgi:chemotaxis protein MotB